MKRYILLSTLILCFTAGTDAQEAFPLTQAECRRIALQNNEELTKANNALRRARLDKEIAFSAYLPKLDGMASGTYMFPDMEMSGIELQMRGMYMAGLSVTQPLYAGGRIVAGNKLARIGQESAAETLRKTRMEVVADADQAYWNYIAVGRKVRMLETYRTQMDTLFRQVETAVKAGMGTDNEEFYASHRFFSFQDFKTQLAVRERTYNNFPIRPLNWRSPKQVLSSFVSL